MVGRPPDAVIKVCLSQGSLRTQYFSLDAGSDVEDISTAPGTSQYSPGFWRGQFQLPATPLQTAFDACFGIIAPVLCVIF